MKDSYNNINAYQKREQNCMHFICACPFLDKMILFQTGLSGNIMILSIFYNGGKMMNEAQITVGELSSFMLYAAFVGVSISGE